MSTAESTLPASFIIRTVSIAILCWLKREVRKNTVLSWVTAYSSAGNRDAAVLPRPVGASANRYLLFSTALRTSSIISFCDRRTDVYGNIIFFVGTGNMGIVECSFPIIEIVTAGLTTVSHSWQRIKV